MYNSCEIFTNIINSYLNDKEEIIKLEHEIINLERQILKLEQAIIISENKILEEIGFLNKKFKKDI